MAQRRDRAGLALEPLLQIRIRGHMRGQHLDGDGAVEAGVSRFVDLAHAPGAQRGFDSIRTEGRSSLKWHRDVGFLTGREVWPSLAAKVSPDVISVNDQGHPIQDNDAADPEAEQAI